MEQLFYALVGLGVLALNAYITSEAAKAGARKGVRSARKERPSSATEV